MRGLSIMCLSVALAGCASIVGDTKETISFNSSPDDAALSIVNENGMEIYKGQTPTTVTLEKADGYFDGQTYTIVFAKEGYDDRTFTIDSSPNGWYIGGNILFGGLIGWFVVDPLTGAMWTLEPENVNVTLTRQLAQVGGPTGLTVASLADVPPDLRSHLTPLQ